MTTTLRLHGTIGLVLVLAACGGGTTGGNDAGGNDAAASDTGGGGTDTGGTDTGTSDPDVARCQSAAAMLMATCPSDGDRTCQVGAYGSFCQAGAHPGEFADAIDCLRAMSSASGGCRTFSDPSGAATCVQDAYAGVTSSDVDAVVARAQMLCTSTAGAVTAEPPLYALSASQLSALATCMDAATDCDAANACANTTAGPIAACFGP